MQLVTPILADSISQVWWLSDRWYHIGYEGRELIFMTKRLAPRSSLAPVLSGEPYVFTTVDGTAPRVPMFAAILEDEGLTLVLTRADADMAGLSYSYVAGRITLGVESSLDEIGLTARVSRVLADAEVSCNDRRLGPRPPVRRLGPAFPRPRPAAVAVIFRCRDA